MFKFTFKRGTWINHSAVESTLKAQTKLEYCVRCYMHRSNKSNTKHFCIPVHCQLKWSHDWFALSSIWHLLATCTLPAKNKKFLKINRYSQSIEEMFNVFLPLLSVASTFWHSKGGSAPVISVFIGIWVKFIIPGPTFFNTSRVQFYINFKDKYIWKEKKKNNCYIRIYQFEWIEFDFLNHTLGSRSFNLSHDSSSHT